MIGPRLKFMLFIATVSSLGLAIGCTQTPPPATTPPPKGGRPPMVGMAPNVELEPGPFLEGRKVFQANSCIKCHSIGDQPAGEGKGMMMKKNLASVGTERTREYIIAHIRDPHTHTEKTRMQPYDTTKISETDMDALADYLTSLKKK
jgi:mono/diheme cytochrome c family protein